MIENSQIGDEVFIHTSFGYLNGKIVHIFLLPGWENNFLPYVIEIDTCIDAHLEIRNKFTMWKHNPDNNDQL